MAVKTIRLNVPSAPIFTASFSFNILDFASRKDVYPDRVYFNATGTGEASYFPPAYSGPFPAWHETHSNAYSWVFQKTETTPPYQFPPQIVQQQPDSTMSTPAGTFFVSRTVLNPPANDIFLTKYNSAENLLTTPVGAQLAVSTGNNQQKPHSMVLSSSRAYIFWLNAENRVQMKTFDGFNFIDHFQLSETNFSPALAISAARLTHGSDEYIAMVYAKDADQTSIAVFKDGNFPSTATFTFNLANVEVDNGYISISQSPRTGKVYLNWLKDSKAYYKTFDFAPPANFTNESAKIGFSSPPNKFFGSTVIGLDNFEVSFTDTRMTGIVENTILKGNATETRLISQDGYSSQFQYISGGQKYLGLITLSGFTSFNFYRRPLHYPSAATWEKANKVLHLQGPPWPGSIIGAEVDFAEVATTTSLAHAVNTNGGRKPFNGATGIIASASTIYSVKFDKDMRTADYPDVIISGKIRMLRSDNSSVPLTYVSGAAREISFKTNDHLAFNTVYRITIASDVIDANGSQIWEAATMTFTTQPTSSVVLASEVIDIRAFSDADRLNSIVSGNEVNATSTIYLRMRARDPAFNTIDTSSISVFRNGSLIANVPVSQEEASSEFFYGQYNIVAPQTENSIYQFITPQSTIYHEVKVDYPTFTPVYPASDSINIPASASIRIKAEEPISALEIDPTTVRLSLGGIAVSAARYYDAITREITIDPLDDLLSEQTYLVTVSGLKDTSGNPQTKTLSYQFRIADVVPPTIVLPTSPTGGATGVKIDQLILVNFSEPILAASANPSTVKLRRGATAASYSVSISGSQMTIDPDDAPDGGLRTQTTYTLEVGPSVTDLAGNGLSNVPATFSMSFTTQPTITAPAAIDSITLYKDPLLLFGWALNERIPASATIYMKVTGTDGAIQTRDAATVSMNLSWTVPGIDIVLNETASNSGGLYTGSFAMNSIPLYGIPAPLPATSIGSLTFTVQQDPAKAATLTVAFPDLVPALSTVNTITGTSPAAGAVNARIDSTIRINFNSELLNAGDATSLGISSGAAAISGSRVLSADKTHITFTPSASLPFSSIITVNAPYSATGLRSPQGNPLFSSFNYSFTTQASQTQPLTATQLLLFPDATYSLLSAYGLNDDLPQSGTIFIEVRAPDAAANTADFTWVSVTTGANVRLNETSANSGVFRGSYTYPALTDGFVFRVNALANTSASQTLIMTIPTIAPVSPASGSTGISVATRVEVAASEALDPTTVNNVSVKLFQGATEIAGAVSYISATRRIEFTPAANLAFNQLYLFRVSGVKDLAGNTQAQALGMSFTTQASTMPPAIINAIKIYSDSGYSSELPDLALVTKSTMVYIEIDAVDASPATTDSTVVTIKSDKSALVNDITLLETSSGRFRGSFTTNNEENATLTFESITDSTRITRLRTYEMPRIISLQPASGSTNIYLDTIFSIFTSKDVSAASVSTASIKIADSSGIASYLPYLHAAKEIRVKTELSPSSLVSLQILPSLKDFQNQSFPETLATFNSLSPAFTQFRLYSNPGPANLLPDNSQVEAGQTIYSLLNGSNAYFYKAEQATATISTDIITAQYTLNEVSAGNFSGSFVVPNDPGKFMTIVPEGIAAFERTLEILPAFSLISFAPADNAMAVPADTWPTWNFSRPVRASDINTTNFKLTKTSDPWPISGTLTVSPSGKQIRFEPTAILSLLTQYEMSVDQNIEDTAGHKLGTTYTTRFTTQPPPLPPTSLISLKNYETVDFATATFAVATNGTLYIELTAVDTSFSTYESSKVRIDSSDGTIDGLEFNLVEIAPPSGIFRASLPVNLPAGTTIRIRSQAAPTFFIDVTARTRTNLTGLNPASASVDLFLDDSVTLSFSQPIDRATAAPGIRMTASAGANINLLFSFADGDRKVIIKPQTGLATSTRHILSINTDLRDTNGLFILPGNAFYTSRSESTAAFDLFTGIGSRAGQSVKQTGEAVRGPVTIVATTTDLFAEYPEFRIISLTTATESFNINLAEQSPGSFVGMFNFSEEMADLINTQLQFGVKPAFNFRLAPLPTLTEIYPASDSRNIPEVPVIMATFSRKIAFNSAAAALTITTANSTVNNSVLGQGQDSRSITWLPVSPLPQQSSCTLSLNGLTDYLGQPLPLYSHVFSTGGRQGINLYRDNSFLHLIATSQIEIPVVHVEVAASGSNDLNDRTFYLQALRGTATTPVLLPLEPINIQSGRFRCSLEFSPQRAPPQYSLPLYPGEWIQLSSPLLTSDQKLFYYLYSGSVSPSTINEIKFYSEKHYAQRVSEYLGNPSLFIEVLAEDLNWVTADTTSVRVTSEADKTGFSLILTESGTHTSMFRNFIFLSNFVSDAAARTLKALPGQRIEVVSETDPSKKASIVYLPENTLKVISVFPSPARGSSINFRFYLNFPADVDLDIFDSSGDEVFSTAIRGVEGENKFRWNFPRRLANGVYFYQLKLDRSNAYPAGKRKARGKFAVLR